MLSLRSSNLICLEKIAILPLLLLLLLLLLISEEVGISLRVKRNPTTMIGTPAKSVEVFYSYAHEDEEMRDKLEKRLESLRRQGLISQWHDRQILAGAEWASTIDTHLDTATV